MFIVYSSKICKFFIQQQTLFKKKHFIFYLYKHGTIDTKIFNATAKKMSLNSIDRYSICCMHFICLQVFMSFFFHFSRHHTYMHTYRTSVSTLHFRRHFTQLCYTVKATTILYNKRMNLFYDPKERERKRSKRVKEGEKNFTFIYV